MKRPLRPAAPRHPEYPTLKALLLAGSLLVGGVAHADASVPGGKREPAGDQRVPQVKGKISVPLPPGVPPRPQPPKTPPQQDKK